MAPDINASRRDLVLLGVAASVGAAGTAKADTPPAAASSPFARGVTRVDHDLTVSEDVCLEPGATVAVADGATLTFAGDFAAPASHVFVGRGTIDLTGSRLVAARPEWWGAIPGTPSIDCRPALDACLAAHTAMQFAPGDYYLATTWRITRHNRRVWGVGRSKDAGGTRLVKAGADGPVVAIGTEATPAAINQFTRGVDMRWIEFGRTQLAAIPADDSVATPCGLRVRHVLDCVFEGLRANEHAVGFRISGAVRTYFRDCLAFRSSAHPDPHRDVFTGFDLSGSPASGLTGSNASLYLVDCNASTGNNLAYASSVGLRLVGPVADTFVIRFETSNVADGIAIDGDAQTRSVAQRLSGYLDLHLDAVVLDQCGRSGISIRNLSEHTLLDIRDPYVALAAGAGTALALERIGGASTISGGQLIGWSALTGKGDPLGIRLDETSGAAFAGIKLAGFARAVDARASSDFEFVGAIDSPGGEGRHPAIALAGCRRGYLRPRVAGKAGGFETCVTLDGACRAITIETGGIDPATIAGASLARVDGRAAVQTPDASRLFIAGSSLR